MRIGGGLPQSNSIHLEKSIRQAHALICFPMTISFALLYDAMRNSTRSK
jgi:hypothetical protein